MVDSPTRILVVDDHPIVRQGLERLIEAEPDLAIAAEAATADEALGLLDEADFVVLDIGLTQGSGLDVIGQIRARAADLPILVLSMHQERFYAERVLRSGAQGYVMKQGDPSEIVPAIRRILSGDLPRQELLSTHDSVAAPASPDAAFRRAVGEEAHVGGGQRG